MKLNNQKLEMKYVLLLLCSTLLIACSTDPKLQAVEPAKSKLVCDCGFIQSALTLMCDESFQLKSIRIKNISDGDHSGFKEISEFAVQKFDNGKFINVNFQYEFDCKSNYQIIINNDKEKNFLVRDFKFRPKPAPTMNNYQEFCDLSSYYVNYKLIRESRIYLDLTSCVSN